MSSFQPPGPSTMSNSRRPMTTAPLCAVARSRISVSTASCSVTHVCSSGASPSPCCSSAPGPVTYPSSDMVMSAMTFGIAVSSWRRSVVQTACRPPTHRGRANMSTGVVLRLPSAGPRRPIGERYMTYAVDFVNVSTIGLESSPVAAALAGLRAHEARYLQNKYDHDFTVEPASNAKPTMDWVNRILKEERDIVISSCPLEATAFQVDNIRIAYVFYESGLSINVMYTVDDPNERAVGFKLSEGMEVPAELASRFKFARQKSKLAGTIRGSYFAFKNE